MWGGEGGLGRRGKTRTVSHDVDYIDLGLCHSTSERGTVRFCSSQVTVIQPTPSFIMLKLTLLFFAIIVLFGRAYSWGGRFNRFSPEMLSNMGYGGYGNNRHAPQVIFFPILFGM